MGRDRIGKIQSHLDLRTVQKRADLPSGIHLGAVPEPVAAPRKRKPTLLRFQELLREIMRGSESVAEAVKPTPATPVSEGTESTSGSPSDSQNVIYVDSSGYASDRRS